MADVRNVKCVLIYFIFLIIHSVAGRDEVPPIPKGCMFGVPYSCYYSAEKVAEANCTQWCSDVQVKLKNDFSYSEGCRYGNAQLSHSYCREGRQKMKCRKCFQAEIKPCCGTCKQDCNLDVVYL